MPTVKNRTIIDTRSIDRLKSETQSINREDEKMRKLLKMLEEDAMVNLRRLLPVALMLCAFETYAQSTGGFCPIAIGNRWIYQCEYARYTIDPLNSVVKDSIIEQMRVTQIEAVGSDTFVTMVVIDSGITVSRDSGIFIANIYRLNNVVYKYRSKSLEQFSADSFYPVAPLCKQDSFPNDSIKLHSCPWGTAKYVEIDSSECLRQGNTCSGPGCTYLCSQPGANCIGCLSYNKMKSVFLQNLGLLSFASSGGIAESFRVVYPPSVPQSIQLVRFNGIEVNSLYCGFNNSIEYYGHLQNAKKPQVEAQFDLLGRSIPIPKMGNKLARFRLIFGKNTKTIGGN
jgi:hypothetical protein